MAWNVWQITDSKWQVVEEGDAPLEFATEAEAHSYLKKCNLRLYPRSSVLSLGESAEGCVLARPVAEETHPSGMLGLSVDAAQATIDGWPPLGSKSSNDLALQLLTARTGGEQAAIWIAALEGPLPSRAELRALQHHKEFGAVIRTCFCSKSRETQQAILTCFCPPRRGAA